jgi:hypothetical protein
MWNAAMNKYLSPETLQLKKDIEAAKEKRRKMAAIAENLKLPTHGGDSSIYMEDLWEILSDEKKLKEFLSRLNNKAFW